MKSRRGVGGLISMIGLVVVFGVVGIAFLSLNTQQTSLFATQQKVNELQHDRNTESFEGKILQCKELNSTHVKFITLRVNNTSTQSLSINSIILYNSVYQNVTDSNYFNGTEIHILPQESKIFDLTELKYHRPFSDGGSVQRIIMLTDFGNKIILDHDFDAGCI